MDISGSLRANCSPEILLATLADARAINRILPEGSLVEDTGEGRYSFTVSRTFGPVRLTLPGQMTLATGDRPQDRKLTLRAAHVIGGKVDLKITFIIDPLAEATKIAYSGTLEATGLAGRIAREKRGSINGVVKGGMTRLKHLAEAQARQGA